MSKPLKWALIAIVCLVVVVLVAVMIAPMVINFEKYKPAIETEASKAIGRNVVLGGKIVPSVFPWVGLALSDVSVENPSGFSEKNFVSVGSFEVRIKLLPLLTGAYEIKRFVIKSPHIVVETSKAGKSNLDGLGGAAKTATAAGSKSEATQKSPQKTGLPIKSLKAEEFAITDGRLLILDQKAGTKQEIKDVGLILTDLSMDQPIGIDFNAIANGHPIQLKGTAGPLGTPIGQKPIQLDIVAALLKKIDARIHGQIENVLEAPRFNAGIQVSPFSLRKALEDANIALPFSTADPQVLNHIALDMTVSGQPDRVVISDGKLTLDDSRITFQGRGQAWNKPDLQLSAELDGIDLDRYLPPPSEKKPSKEDKARTPTPETAETDYAPLRKLVLDAQLKAGRIKAKNMIVQDITLKATARDGIIRIDPLGMTLYDGHLAAKSTVNVQSRKPLSKATVTLDGVQSAPLIKDLLDKEMIQGMMSAALDLQFSGDTADTIRKTLSGNGKLQFNDGAIVGLDLGGMVRNVQSAFGLAEKSSEKPRTDFSELVVQFIADNGVTTLEVANLVSPLLRVAASGSADLAQETLNLRIDPKFVGTLKGQGDAKERSGVMVPVNVGGTFEKPKFKPDLKALLEQPLPDKEALKKAIPTEKELKQDLEKKGMELLKGLTLPDRKKD